MADYPALPLWTDAYFADTRHLTAAQHGCYLLLLMTAWRRPNCDLPDDDKFLSNVTGLRVDHWRRQKPAVMEFFYLADGRWRQKRLDKVRADVERRTTAAKLAAEARWAKTPLRPPSTHGRTSPPNVGRTSPKTPIKPPEKPCGRISQRNANQNQNQIDPPLPPRGGNSRKRSKVGTRMHPDWKPSDELLRFAANEGMTWTAAKREAAKFRDYWVSVPGQRGLKLDWRAVWRNWIRKALEMNHNPQPQTKTDAEAEADWIAMHTDNWHK